MAWMACSSHPPIRLHWRAPSVRSSTIPSTRERIGEGGYRTVVERFSIDAQVKRIEALYDEELARAGVLARVRPPQPVRETSRPIERGALEMPPV